MKGRKRVSEECEEESAEGMPASKFEVDKPILGFHKKQLYAGKALKRRRRGDTWQYLMHWNGWGSKYDEWLNEDLLYPDTDESRRVAESLRSSVPTDKQGKGKKNKKDGPADAMAEDVEGDHLIQFIIPHTLQTHLLREADFIKDGRVLFVLAFLLLKHCMAVRQLQTCCLYILADRSGMRMCVRWCPFRGNRACGKF